MKKIVDIHSHILPNVDDGAKDWNETYQMLHIAYQEGVRTIIVTPHHHERRGMCTPQQYKENFIQLRNLAHEIDENFHVILGMEIYFSQDIIQKLENKAVQPMGKSKYLLIEFSPDAEFRYIQQGLQQVQMKGYYLILAHIERYQCLMEDMGHVEHLIEMGVYMQMNAGSILSKNDRKERRFIKNLLKNEYIHFIGTDAHNAGSRSPKIKECADYVAKKYGEEYAAEIFSKNALKVLKNQII